MSAPSESFFFFFFLLHKNLDSLNLTVHALHRGYRSFLGLSYHVKVPDRLVTLSTFYLYESDTPALCGISERTKDTNTHAVVV